MSTYALDYHLDSRFSNLELKTRNALDELAAFWSEMYGPNEALAAAYDALQSMRETWEEADDVPA